MSCVNTFLLVLLATVAFGIQFPKIHIDTDPENMLPANQADRVLYNRAKQDFGIHDLIVLGITDEAGMFRPDPLARVARVVKRVEEHLRMEPPPVGVQVRWSGLTYINKVWQDEMVVGMMKAVLGGFVAVFVLMILETVVGRRPGCVPGGVWQGTTRRNSQLLQRVVTQPGAVRRVHWVA